MKKKRATAQIHISIIHDTEIKFNKRKEKNREIELNRVNCVEMLEKKFIEKLFHMTTAPFRNLRLLATENAKQIL